MVDKIRKLFKPDPTVLFIGDSIVEGSIGVSFTDRVERQVPDIRIINEGVPGDTLPGICRRLLAILEKDTGFDSIVMEGGHNDILAAHWFGMRDSLTIVEDLDRVLKGALEEVAGIFKGRVILTTLSCLGEDLELEENKTRFLLNERIKGYGLKYGFKVADVGKAFDEVLKRGGEVSLTIDGVHINEAGAGIYAREIIKSLM